MAGGFVSHCLGYTVGYKDIDIFVSPTAFAKLVQRVGDLKLGIRLVRLYMSIVMTSLHFYRFSLAPDDLSKSTYWEHNFQVYNVYCVGKLTKLQVTP